MRFCGKNGILWRKKVEQKLGFEEKKMEEMGFYGLKIEGKGYYWEKIDILWRKKWKR